MVGPRLSAVDSIPQLDHGQDVSLLVCSLQAKLTSSSGTSINPSWFELKTSRGLDDPLLKVFMRATVLASEYIFYVPAVMILV
jgi:hypothetical protein